MHEAHLHTEMTEVLVDGVYKEKQIEVEAEGMRVFCETCTPDAAVRREARVRAMKTGRVMTTEEIKAMLAEPDDDAADARREEATRRIGAATAEAEENRIRAELAEEDNAKLRAQLAELKKAK